MVEVSEFAEIDSRFTGMISVLCRILRQDRNGWLRSISDSDMGYAVRLPRRT